MSKQPASKSLAKINPLHEARVIQNVIVSMYIDQWLTVSLDDRVGMPFRLRMDSPAPRWLVDREGALVGEVRPLGDEYILLWIRAARDLARMDQALNEIDV